mmetsp:Transcript_6479/g.15295  ORF Transcript_6479/g.15295 Transcript_6479/m.15295 type:complete len:265 (-) Transcript_6479:383-1177(-)
MTKIMSTNSKKRAREEDPDVAGATKAVFVSNRDADFNESTWWMVDIENYNGNQGATALVKRCMRNYGWNFEKTKTILQAYRQFLTLKKGFEDWDAEILSPSHLVDKMWHQHILDIGNYCHDMMMLCGRVVSHNPDGALDIQAKMSRDWKTRSELIKKFGFRNVDREVWGFPEEATNAISDRSRAEGKCITVRIRDQAGEETLFKIKRSQRMRSVFRCFAERKGIERKSFVFLFDGERVDDWHTPAYLEMEDRDEICAVFDCCGC